MKLLANKYIKKCPTSLAISEMSMKTTLRFYVTLLKMVLFKKKHTDKNAENEDPIYYFV